MEMERVEEEVRLARENDSGSKDGKTMREEDKEETSAGDRERRTREKEREQNEENNDDGNDGKFRTVDEVGAEIRNGRSREEIRREKWQDSDEGQIREGNQRGREGQEGMSGGGEGRGGQKRQRSRNFTKHEKKVFYAIFGKYAATITSKQLPVDTIRMAWEQLLQEYNSQRAVYPRTRRQLQVLWRDEKFRARKRRRYEQLHRHEEDREWIPRSRRTSANEEEEAEEETVERRETRTMGRGKLEEEESQNNSNRVTLLLTKRNQEDSTAPITTAFSHLIPADPSYFSATPSTCYYSRTSETEECPASILPVDTQLESCSSASPLIKQEVEEEVEEGMEDKPSDPSLLPGRGPRLFPQYWPLANGPSPQHPHVPTPTNEALEMEYHKARMAQLQEEGAARLRVLEEELTMYKEERHRRQQEHQLKMQILRERLKKMEEQEDDGSVQPTSSF